MLESTFERTSWRGTLHCSHGATGPANAGHRHRAEFWLQSWRFVGSASLRAYSVPFTSARHKRVQPSYVLLRKRVSISVYAGPVYAQYESCDKVGLTGALTQRVEWLRGIFTAGVRAMTRPTILLVDHFRLLDLMHSGAFIGPLAGIKGKRLSERGGRLFGQSPMPRIDGRLQRRQGRSHRRR